jgi:hypothetical protein
MTVMLVSATSKRAGPRKRRGIAVIMRGRVASHILRAILMQMVLWQLAGLTSFSFLGPALQRRCVRNIRKSMQEVKLRFSVAEIRERGESSLGRVMGAI